MKDIVTALEALQTQVGLCVGYVEFLRGPCIAFDLEPPDATQHLRLLYTNVPAWAVTASKAE
jgi:hypothetical protein